MQMESITDILKEQTAKILSENQSHSSTIQCHSYINSETQYYLLHLNQIPTTMLLTQRIPRQMVTKNRIIGFIAKSQTKGRGQRSNSWMSPQGNLYLSVICKIKPQILPYISYTVINCVTQTINSVADIAIRIKWVNDLFYKDKKVGGILLKCDMVGTEAYLQIGVGLNIKVSPLQSATCLQDHSDRELNVEEIGKKITINIGKILGKNISDGEIRLKIRESYEEKLMFQGELVNIYDASLEKIMKRGMFKEINEYGFAVLTNGKGEQEVVSDGRMRVQKESPHIVE